jgi:hypothetical protein
MNSDDLGAPEPSGQELQDQIDERLIRLSETLPESLSPDIGDLVSELAKLASALVGGPVGAFADYFSGKLFPRALGQRLHLVVASIERRVAAQNLRLRRAERRIEDLGAQHHALLREGLESAERATSDERVELIGAIVGDGLSGDELEAEFERAQIRTLNALTDRDVATLRLIARPQDRSDPPPFGPDYARQFMLGRAIETLSTAHLNQLELIENPTSLEERPRLGALPPRTHLLHHPTRLTPAGQSLLIRLDEAAAPVPDAPEEFPSAPMAGSAASPRRKGGGKVRRRT